MLTRQSASVGATPAVATMPVAQDDSIERAANRQMVIVISALVLGVIVLVGLVAALTLIPAQTLSSTLVDQIAEQQKLAAGSLARQVESLFNLTASDILSLAARDEVRSIAPDLENTALVLFNEVGGKRVGQVKEIVRTDTDGTPLYGWPQAIETQIQSKQPLDWRIDSGVMFTLIQSGGVQLIRRTTGSSSVYVLVAPVTTPDNRTQAIAAEIDLNTYFTQSFDALNLPDTAQLWAFDPVSHQVVYQRQPSLNWTNTNYDFLNAHDVTLYSAFPTSDRNAVVAPIYTSFTQDRSQTPSLVLLVSRLSSEGSDTVYSTLNKLFFGGVGFVILITLMGIGIARYVVVEEARRRREQQRRSTVRTLLEMSRALNSSLDLPVVLNKILDELGQLLPHDSASIMLLDGATSEETVVKVAARRGIYEQNAPDEYPLQALRGAREVVRSGKPVVINDTATDPRWESGVGGSVSAWLGVPLQLRNEPVGLLNINSLRAGRFGTDDMEMAEAFADQACVAIQNARAHELQIQQYESELQTAHAIQTSLLPRETPPVPQIELSAQSFPARHVSGDYYQYLPLPDGRLGIAIGDVSGKGIPAALLMAVITTTLREEILRQTSAAGLLERLNGVLLDRMRETHMNSALLVAIFDPRTRRTEIANGGMVQPYFRTPTGWESVPVGGYPLGISARGTYRSKTVTLAPGSALVCVSDGVIEASNASGEIFGEERFETLLHSLPLEISSADVVDRIVNAVREHLAGLEAQDDLTVLAMNSIDL